MAPIPLKGKRPRPKLYITENLRRDTLTAFGSFAACAQAVHLAFPRWSASYVRWVFSGHACSPRLAKAIGVIVDEHRPPPLDTAFLDELPDPWAAKPPAN